IDTVDNRTGMALHTGFFHVLLSVCVARTLRRNLGGQQVGESLTWVVRYLLAIEPAHVTGGAGGNKHFARRELLRGDAKFELPSLGREHDAVLRFVVDFELRVVGAHVTLATRGRQAGDLDGRSVPGVAGGAVADRPVRVRLADPVALGTATDDGRL